jgi:hypothetical protein
MESDLAGEAGLVPGVTGSSHQFSNKDRLPTPYPTTFHFKI